MPRGLVYEGRRKSLRSRGVKEDVGHHVTGEHFKMLGFVNFSFESLTKRFLGERLRCCATYPRNVGERLGTRHLDRRTELRPHRIHRDITISDHSQLGLDATHIVSE